MSTQPKSGARKPRRKKHKASLTAPAPRNPGHIRIVRRGELVSVHAETTLPRANVRLEVGLARVLDTPSGVSFQFVQFDALDPNEAVRVLAVHMDRLLFDARRRDPNWGAFCTSLLEHTTTRTADEVNETFDRVMTAKTYETQTLRASVDRMTHLGTAASVTFGVIDGTDIALVAGSENIDHEARFESVVEVTMGLEVLAELARSTR